LLQGFLVTIAKHPRLGFFILRSVFHLIMQLLHELNFSPSVFDSRTFVALELVELRQSLLSENGHVVFR